MKKTLAIFSILVIVFALFCFGYSSVKKKTESNRVEHIIENLPQFSFYTLDGKVFTHNSLKKKRPVIFLYFHPNCEHCQYEITQFLNNKKYFEKVEIVMISFANVNEIKNFIFNYQLDQLPCITVLSDKDMQFEKYFGNAIPPTTIVYSSERMLKKKFKGEIKIEAIIDCLN